MPRLVQSPRVELGGCTPGARLTRLECVALVADHEALTAEIVKAARALGHRVLCYTPNDAARIGELAGWNVDGIITDAVDHIVADSLPPAPPL